jgi:hypothetical protein
MDWPAQIVMGPRSNRLAQAQRSASRPRMAGMMLVGRTVTARAASIGAGLVMSVLVARQLGPPHAGVFILLLATLTGAATLGRLGTDNLALKFVATNARGSHSALRQLFLTCAVASVFTAGGLYFVAVNLLSARSRTINLKWLLGWPEFLSFRPLPLSPPAQSFAHRHSGVPSWESWRSAAARRSAVHNRGSTHMGQPLVHPAKTCN